MPWQRHDDPDGYSEWGMTRLYVKGGLQMARAEHHTKGQDRAAACRARSPHLGPSTKGEGKLGRDDLGPSRGKSRGHAVHPQKYT